MKVPLTGPESRDRVTIVVKSLGRDEVKVGSISIPQEVFYMAGESKHRQWVTLFDHIDDDEYDGEMGENDDERPRILFTFDLAFEKEKPQPKPSPQTASSTQPKAKHNLANVRSPTREPAVSNTKQVAAAEAKKHNYHSNDQQQRPLSTTAASQPQTQTIVKKPAGRQAVSSGLPQNKA